tara:strand:+ start:201 stop:497 length:297 start_codon:yes stop_codon:yes gene_type:complete
MMQDGECSELTKPVLRIAGTESGSWLPTPTVQDSKNNGSLSQQKRAAKKKFQTLNGVIGGPLNPEFVEWVMGWPIGFSDLEPLVEDGFLQWERLHGAY